MIRALLKLIIVVGVLVAAAMFLLGYRFVDGGVVRHEAPAVGTSGRAPMSTERAREAGAEVGEKVAAGANEARAALRNASLTAKIKSKMALDDTIKAADINVDTAGSVVTLTGTVHSEAERTRAVQLAKETQGVTSVTDRLVVRR